MSYLPRSVQTTTPSPLTIVFLGFGSLSSCPSTSSRVTFQLVRMDSCPVMLMLKDFPGETLKTCVVCTPGFFFRHLVKNSRAKKLKLKENFSKTQGIFALKLKKPAILRQNVKFEPQICLFRTKKRKILQKLKDFSKLKPKICQKLKKPANPLSLVAEKTAKKKACLNATFILLFFRRHFIFDDKVWVEA